MKSFKITTAIALSSALLLTACGGSSSSSGDNKVTNPNASIESKAQTLVGYWKSDCKYDKEDKKSYQGYAQWGTAKGKLIFKDLFGATFNGKGCKGKAVYSHDSEDDAKGTALTKEQIKKVIFDGVNKVTVKEDDGQVNTLYRMQAKNFPKYNYTNGR